MKFKNKGRKIYKTKEKNYYEKSLSSKVLSVGLSFLFLGGLVFIGYSVAEPIMNYTKKKGDSDIPPVTDYSSINTEAQSDISSSISVNSIVKPDVSAVDYHCASVSPSDLTDITNLKTALSNMVSFSDIEYVMVPLKIKGGNIYYATSNEEAALSGAVHSTLTLSEITTEIKNSGYKPVAYISVLNDNVYPSTYQDAAYKTADDGSLWIDNSIENGGKPWISPFSDAGVEYINTIVSEISVADFQFLVCGDVCFPPFRESDIEYIGDDVRDSERYLVLTSLINTIYSNALNNGCSTMLEVSAADIITGKADVLKPMVLQVSTIILDIDFDAIGTSLDANGMIYEFNGTVAENTEKALKLAGDKLSDYNVIVRVSGSNLGTNDLLNAKNVINEYGYETYGYKSYILG